MLFLGEQILRTQCFSGSKDCWVVFRVLCIEDAFSQYSEKDQEIQYCFNTVAS